MNGQPNSPVILSAVKMTNKQFLKLSTYVTKNWGIKLPKSKKLMLEGRLRKRLLELKFDSYDDYISYLFSDEGQEHEIWKMISMVSTNKTDFFREAEHFNYLVEKALPELQRSGIGSIQNPFKFWSAGCSSGEEPYTMSMVLSEYTEEHRGFKWNILATDISSRVLEIACKAIYSKKKIEPIPMALRKKYLLRGKKLESHNVRIVPELRKKIRFGRLNLMELDDCFDEKFHVIFCRNVIIYFDRDVQEKLMHSFHKCLEPGGFLFLGHSEALTGMEIPLTAIAPMVYRKL